MIRFLKYEKFRLLVLIFYEIKCIINIDKSKGVFIMAEITKDTIIMDVLNIDEGTASFFYEIGMHCLGCPSASGETVEEACAVHGVDVDELVEKINEFIKDK